jgi:protein-S-isoprenylcysteine O-methyltransferase Ste14
MWLTFFFLAPLSLYRLEEKVGIAPWRFSSSLWRSMAVALFAAGGTLGLTSAWFMVTRGAGTPLPVDATRSLVVAGPYRYVRNPMAIGSFAQGIAVGLFLGSPLATIYALTGSVGWNYFVRPWEELDLERRFGVPYIAYKESVRCWIPRLEPYEPEREAQR